MAPFGHINPTEEPVAAFTHSFNQRQIRVFRFLFRVFPSQCLVAATSGKRKRAQLEPLPTLMEIPSSLLTSAKPHLSLRSSPINTGHRPLNGCSARYSVTAVPLSMPEGLISTTCFPCCTSSPVLAVSLWSSSNKIMPDISGNYS